jgi:signal transduction histidine kinase
VRRLPRPSRPDLALAACLAALGGAEGALSADPRWPLPVAIVSALGFTLPFAFRVQAPLAAFAVALAAWALPSLAYGRWTDAFSFTLALLVGLYSIGAHASAPRSLAGVAAVAVIAVLLLLGDPDPPDAAGFAFFVLVVGAPWAVGRLIGARRGREAQEIRAAVDAERTRIARELHDIVAHAISVIILQARGARHSVGSDPDDVVSAVDAIERTATQALAEMRRLLAILREDAPADLAPQPSLAHLELLARDVRRAGVPVELRVEGVRRELSPGVDASAYRIVQEALTNTLKHAGRARASVVVRYRSDRLEVEVADDGNGPADEQVGGHGLLGMRERAAVFGGSVEAGPLPEGGYAIRALLPL